MIEESQSTIARLTRRQRLLVAGAIVAEIRRDHTPEDQAAILAAVRSLGLGAEFERMEALLQRAARIANV